MKKKIAMLALAMFGFVATSFTQMDGIEAKGTLIFEEEHKMSFVMKTEIYIDVEEDQFVHYRVIYFDGEISSVFVTTYPIKSIKSLKTGKSFMTVYLKDDVELIQKRYPTDEQPELVFKGYVEFDFASVETANIIITDIQNKLTALESTYFVPTSEMEHSFVYGPKDNLQIVEWNGTPYRTSSQVKYKWEDYAFANDAEQSFERYKATYEIGKPEIIGVEFWSTSYSDVIKIGVTGKTCYVVGPENFGFLMTFYKEHTKTSDYTTLYFDFDTEAEAEQCRQHFQAVLDAYNASK